MAKKEVGKTENLLRLCIATIVSAIFLLTTSENICACDNAKWVDPMIGTGLSDAPTLWGNYGGTYPGAVSPWGMVQLSPETSIRPSERGYYYSDDKILYFSCLGHNSGYPNGSSGILKLTFLRGKCETLPKNYSGRKFSHSDEVTRAGYYKVCFSDGDNVEMTAATHAGIFRYTTSEAATTVMVHNGGKLNVASSTEVQCEVGNAILQFSQPMLTYALRGDTLMAQFAQKGQLKIAVSASAIGYEQSRNNGKKQLCAYDFDAIRRKAYNDWVSELACVDLNKTDEKTKRMFYTALYHSMLLPCNVADVGERPCYKRFSPWDTFRTLHPLLSLLKPNVQRGMVESMMNEYRHRETLPGGPMTGVHSVAIMLDSYVKGTAGEYSLEEIYEACRATFSRNLHRKSFQQYVQQGYVDAHLQQSVSVTAELAYDDWAMMRICDMLGKKDEKEKYAKRAKNYANLWNVEEMFMLPRSEDMWYRHSGELGYQESNKWTASLFAPHSMNHLVNLSGGAKEFATRLQSFFHSGKIIFDNEPVLYYPWLFVWGQRPDLALRQVRQVVQESYSDLPGGIPGNDDLGSMSSWLAFSIMGIMPICPGTDQYATLPPMAGEVVIHTDDGKTMTIENQGEIHSGIMPQPTLNGRKMRRCYVTHNELSAGGKLSFDWSIQFDAEKMQPMYSMDTDSPKFKITTESNQRINAYPNEEIKVPLTIKNTGAEGVYMATVTCHGDTLAKKNVFVRANSCATDTITFRLYAEGVHRLYIADSLIEVNVKKNERQTAQLSCEDIDVKPIIKVGNQIEANVSIKNISGRRLSKVLTVNVDGNKATQIVASLRPGECKKFSVLLDIPSKGIHKITVLDNSTMIKVYEDACEATVLDADYQADGATDHSGFHNDGIYHGALLVADGEVTSGSEAYVEFPETRSLMYPYQQFTMLTWIWPSRENGRDYIDFFTKGDYTLMKMQGGDSLAFFAGGWGRGQCEVPIPDDWFDRWHLVAGVCYGGRIALFIDGRKQQEVMVKGTIMASEMPWNIGRNAEMPFSRFGKMQFKGTRIYAEPLSEAQIMNIYSNELKK